MAKIRLNDRQDSVIICCGTEALALKEDIFDTEKDYRNEYAQVYFRINAPHYQFTLNYP